MLDVLKDSADAAPTRLLKVLADPEAAGEMLGGGRAVELFEHAVAANPLSEPVLGVDQNALFAEGRCCAGRRGFLDTTDQSWNSGGVIPLLLPGLVPAVDLDRNPNLRPLRDRQVDRSSLPFEVPEAGLRCHIAKVETRNAGEDLLGKLALIPGLCLAEIRA